MSVQDYGIAGAANVASPLIWKDCPKGAMAKDPSRYIDIWEDFDGGVAADVAYYGKFEVVGTNADIDVIDDEYYGVIALSGSDADNEGSFLKSNALYDLTMNNSKRFWFEARVNVVDVSLDQAIVVGLMEPTGCTAEGIADNGADIIDEDYIGFLAITDATNMGNIQAVYQNGGDAAHTDVVAAAHTAVDDTYVKLGMRFDGKQTVTFYVNGASVGTLDVDDLTSNQLANPLCIFVGIKDCVGGATTVLQVDWIRFACEKVASGY